ncbi:putative Ribonucleotide reductase inhibitor-domain-containing protein [Seiridium unicorne]|uniref:Ribonucleotide reductase inhibitor-domain-containing protein n=1 Tax=Seiridium unicorne TaxID=138068 RepID=A0ABR2V2S2_9PEZI
MSAPRTKRQFAGAASDPAQRRITSFFASSGSLTSSAPADETVPRCFAAADSSTQANLLSVGMRVRKAVPEGYKTAGYNAFSLWDENKKDSAPTSTTYDAGISRGTAVSTAKELLPFCGIHRVGGFDTQASSAADDFAFSLPSTDIPLGLLDPEIMDEVPGLTLSQESVEYIDSTGPDVTGARTRKRFFADEEMEPETPDRLNVMGWQDIEVSPRSLAPIHIGNGRRMAVPRKGGLRGKLGIVGVNPIGQENAMVADNDFEEASFLDQSHEVDMDDV